MGVERQIPLRRRDGSIRAYALVDEEDYEDVSRWRWCLRAGGRYAGRDSRERGERSVVYMHQHIAGTQHVDHENGDGLDNRRSNLRTCPRGQHDNAQNRKRRSRPRGVSFHRAARKWEANAMLDGRKVYLGLHATEAEAASVAAAWRAEHMPFSEDARAA